MNIKKLKVQVYNLIRDDDDNTTAADIVDGVIIVLILINVIFTILDTFDTMPQWYHSLSTRVEAVLTIAFTLEYILRIWTATLMFPQSSPWRARLKFALRPTSIVDLLSILPFYLPMVLPTDLRVLRLLRLVRLFRLFKVGRYTDAIYIIQEVFHRKKAQLISSMFTILLLIVISSVLMFGLESTAQPAVFENALDGLWWSLATLTSASYGDIYPVTLAGRLLAAVISLLGIGLIAVPTGIISAGFVEVAANVIPDAPAPDPTIPDEIREYRALMDEGAITQEEYEAKKRQLLGL